MAMLYFATGEGGRFAQYTSGFTLLAAIGLIFLSAWIKKDSPGKARRLKNIGIWLIGLIPIVFLIVVLVKVILFGLFWTF